MAPPGPDALMLVSTHCPHCHALEKLLREREAKGVLGALEVVNIEKSPEVAQRYGVKSVPWLRLGVFVFDEAPAPSELDAWINDVKEGNGQSRYIAYLLAHGKLPQAVAWIEEGNATLKSVITILQDPDAKINVRVGIGAILEHFEDTESIRAIIPDLVALLEDSSPTTRIDACHYLSLTHSREAIEPLKQVLEDENGQVRQVAKESIDALVE